MKERNTLADQARTDVSSIELPIDRQRRSGFVLHEINVSAALAVLDSFLDEDEAEQRQTFHYLKHALDEDRAGQGERLLLFP
jgi:hypothetical protein